MTENFTKQPFVKFASRLLEQSGGLEVKQLPPISKSISAFLKTPKNIQANRLDLAAYAESIFHGDPFKRIVGLDQACQACYAVNLDPVSLRNELESKCPSRQGGVEILTLDGPFCDDHKPSEALTANKVRHKKVPMLGWNMPQY